MISSVIFMGTLVGASFIITFLKLPGWFKRFLSRHPLFTEVCASVLIFVTITAITKTVLGIMSSFWADFVWTIFYFIYRENPSAKIEMVKARVEHERRTT